MIVLGGYSLAASAYELYESNRASTRQGTQGTNKSAPTPPTSQTPSNPQATPSSTANGMEYIVELPDSNDQVVVHNSAGQLTSTGGFRGTNSAIGTVIKEGVADIIMTGGKKLAARAADRAVDYVLERLPKKKQAKKASGQVKRRAGTKQEQAIIVAPRAPKPYVTTTAPVSYGATLAGSKTISRKTRQGHIVIGREFLGAAYDTKAITTWTMCLGAPLTPVSFVDSILRQYGAMYNYFRWRKLTVHYVTTSPTSTAGSVMLYYNKDRASTFINQTSPNLMPFVLSDPHTTIGPQWQNFSVMLETDSEWKRLDYGLTDDSTHYTAGEVFLLSKTAASTDSPGMLLMEYEIEFKDENLTPRLLLWPQPTINYIPYTFAIPSSTTAGNPVSLLLATTPVMGPNTNLVQPGGIYKVIVDVTNSDFSGTTPALNPNNIWKYPAGSGTYTANLVDGSTLYAVNGPTNVQFFTTLADAYVNNSPVQWYATITASTGRLFMWLSLLGYVGNSSINPNM